MPLPRHHPILVANCGDMLAPRDLYKRSAANERPVVPRTCERCSCVMASDRHPRDKYCSPCERKVLQW